MLAIGQYMANSLLAWPRLLVGWVGKGRIKVQAKVSIYPGDRHSIQKIGEASFSWQGRRIGRSVGLRRVARYLSHSTMLAFVRVIEILPTKNEVTHQLSRLERCCNFQELKCKEGWATQHLLVSLNTYYFNHPCLIVSSWLDPGFSH